MFERIKRLLQVRAGSPGANIFGTVESATRNGISGWVANGGRAVVVRIKAGEQLIHEGRASWPRPDIDRIYGRSGAMGFSFGGDAPSENEEPGRVELRVRCDLSGEWHPALPPR